MPMAGEFISNSDALKCSIASKPCNMASVLLHSRYVMNSCPSCTHVVNLTIQANRDKNTGAGVLNELILRINGYE